MKDLVVTPRNLQEVRADIASEAVAHADVIAAFHRVFYDSPNTHTFTNWMGVPILKNPLDLWIYQEILWDLKPTLIIETGTAYGGSALYFAHMMDRRAEGRVITVDIEPNEPIPYHRRLIAIKGSSTDEQILSQIAALIKPDDRVMVVLDSDHSAAYVKAELDIYSHFVTPGQFLVVEDTNINGNPVSRDWMGGPGPMTAVQEWLPQHPEFQPDILAERMMVTFYPDGWLRRTP